MMTMMMMQNLPIVKKKTKAANKWGEKCPHG
jgi:hypothetical protein